MCNVTPEWCLHVPDYTCPALFTSSEKQFLQGDNLRKGGCNPLSKVVTKQRGYKRRCRDWTRARRQGRGRAANGGKDCAKSIAAEGTKELITLDF